MKEKLKIYKNKKTGQLSVVLPKKLFLDKEKVNPRFLKFKKKDVEW